MDVPLPPHQLSNSSLSYIVAHILELEFKLSRPDDQSEYFRWGIDNHHSHLKYLHCQYGNFRDRFNGNTVDDFRSELNIQKEILGRIKSSLRAGFIRSVAMSALQFKVAEIEDMLLLKGVVSQLPEFDELKINSAVWDRILESL
jgi:hypothetical protein